MAKRLILSIIMIAGICAVLSWAVMYWYTNFGMSPEEQFEGFCRTTPIKSKLLNKIEHNPCDTESITQLVDVLILEGDLGRADTICRIHGIHSARLDEVLALCREMDEDADDGTLDNRKADERWMSLVNWPVYGALRFNQGYRYAVLGDWKSAMSEMLAIKNPKSGIVCPILLTDHVDYLLARAYQEEGQDADALKLLRSLFNTNKENGLRPKIYTATISSALTLGDMKTADSAMSRLDYVNGYTWEKSKASVLYGNYHKSKGDTEKALNFYVEAIKSNESSGAIAKEALAGIFDILKSRNEKLKIVPNTIMSIASEAAEVGLEAHALDSFKIVGQSSATTDIKNEIALATLYLELDIGKIEQAKGELTRLNLSDASDDVVARALYYLAMYEKKKRDYEKAAFHFKESAALAVPVSAESRWELYLLSKANKTNNTYNLPQATTDLEFIIEYFPSSERFVEAAEELLPVYYYQGKTDKAKELISKLKGNGRTAEIIQAYWTYRLADKAGDDKGKAQAVKQLEWRSYTYYELYTSDKPSSGDSSLKPIIQQPERVDEFFYGMGLSDLGRESAINAEWLLPDISLASDVFSRANYGTPESAAWYSEKLLEKGVVTMPELVSELIRIAFPRPFEQEVRKSASRHSISPALVWAVMKKESSFKPDAVSSAGARGLMQLMPDTAAWLIGGGRASISGDWGTDPAANIELGCAYLAHLKFERTAHQPDEVIISAYNGGPGNANTWASRYSGAPGWLYVELIPNTENEVFTKKVLKYELIYQKLEGNT